MEMTIVLTFPFPWDSSPIIWSSSSWLHSHGISGSIVRRNSVIWNIDSCTSHPMAMILPSGHALWWTKPFNVFIKCSRKNIHWLCTIPTTCTSSTMWNRRCICIFNTLDGKNLSTMAMASSLFRCALSNVSLGISFCDIYYTKALILYKVFMMSSMSQSLIAMSNTNYKKLCQSCDLSTVLQHLNPPIL